MGNDNKIKDITKSPANQFLPEEIKDREGRVSIYSLEDEFEKTRKNRNYPLMFVIIGFIAVVTVGTILFTYWMDQRQRRTEVSISEFQDVRLKELIDAAKKNESKLDVAKRELNALKLEMDKSLLSVKDTYKAKKEAVAGKNLPADESARQMAKLDAQQAAETKKIEATYNKKIKDKEAEAKRLENDVALSSKKVGVAASNVDKLYELKLNKVKNDYEAKIEKLILKYNPKFTNQKLNNILNNKVAYSHNDMVRYRQKIADYNLIMENMLKIPYINSVDPAVKQMSNISKPVMSELYEKTNSYNYAFDYILETKPENGYIIDARNPQYISLHINRLLRVKNGETASIFRDDDEYIGSITIYQVSGGYKGKVIEVAKGKKIQPFDKILLNLSRE